MESSIKKRSSQSSMSDSDENLCILCFKEAQIYSIGECDHPVCHECSARMRALCRRNECPVCRKDMTMVVFVSTQQLFRQINYKTMKYERKYLIYFENDEIMKTYDKLMEHHCSYCQNGYKFTDFLNLKTHVLKSHDRHYCEICVEHLTIFTHERKAYTRTDLATHRRKGDADDRSHRGHAICEYCNTRFLDDDMLFVHLRRDHFFCHFCDADGISNQYYGDYPDLRTHFEAEHFVCKEGDCREEKFTSVYRSKIDLQAHWTMVHSQTATKQQIRLGRTIDVTFPVNRDRPRRGRGGGPGSQRRTLQDVEDQETAAAALPPTMNAPQPQTSVDISCAQDFPSLGRPVAAAKGNGKSDHRNRSIAQKMAHENRFSVRSGGRLMAEDFPALGSTTTTPAAAQPHTVPQESTCRKPVIQNQLSSRDHVSLMNHATPSTASSTSLSKAVKNKIVSGKSVHKNGVASKAPKEEFPALGEASVKHAPVSWGNSAKIKYKPIEPKRPKPQSKKNNADFTTNDFPSLKPSSAPTRPVSSVSHKKPPAPNTLKTANGVNTNVVPQKNINKDTYQSKKRTTKKVMTLINAHDELNDDGPSADYSMSKEGDYESMAPRSFSNISMVTKQEPVMKKAATELASIHIKAGSSDFPSLGGGNVASDHNSNWVANKAVKAKPKKNKPAPPSTKPKVAKVAAVKSFDFLPPPDFEKRNKMLIDMVKCLCEGHSEKFIKFKHLAELLRSGQILHRVYYNQCKSVVGKAGFHAILPELLCLLPDIQNQQGVYEAYIQMDDGEGCDKDFHLCPVCNQVLIERDLKHHQMRHPTASISIPRK